ncbi:helix-turn-helix domain-containing protein [Amphibacillus sediminis]|uniref:helix-turn-helix domain-containing protein n=1 Tax=Amphibacillus sediminis TaxID=360185 RepID=UPI00082A540C|nr:helix-turn-helix domain-containing protein [Amphibacillus sediminis]
MNNQTEGNLAYNLASLRKQKQLSQEKVAEAIGVTRQSVAKWEAGDSVPDIVHCDALSNLYEVSLDDLVHFDQRKNGVPVPPKDKHLFGTVQIGERGQIVIPKKARDMFGLKQGDALIVLGDSNPESAGIALMPEQFFLSIANHIIENRSSRGDSK